jgi:hypothetical protein
MFYALLEWMAIGFLFLASVTQILVPLYKGTHLFPTLRKRNTYKQITDAREEIEDEELALERELLLLKAKKARERRIRDMATELEKLKETGESK